MGALLAAAGPPNHPSRKAWARALSACVLSRAGVLARLAGSREAGEKCAAEAVTAVSRGSARLGSSVKGASPVGGAPFIFARAAE